MSSVEWLSTTITLKEKSAVWPSALWTASRMVRSRLRTGMMTLASNREHVARTGHGTKFRRQPGADSPQMCVAICSISIW